MSFRVFIGVGHGGSDPGASRYVKEKDANLTIALELQRILEANDCVVGMSRIVDENDPVSEEVREANAFGPDLAVEVHNNAGGGDGWECYVQTNSYAAQSRACAAAIEAEVKAIGQNSRGIKTRGFLWTSNVKAPAVLLEGFFVDNAKDAADFDSVDEQKALAGAYARGILQYFGLETKLPKPEPAPSEPIYTVTASGSVLCASAEAASNVAAALGKLGFSSAVETTGADRDIQEKDIVRVKQGARYYDAKYKDKIPNPVLYNREHMVTQIDGDRVVLSSGGVTIGAVHKKDLIFIKG